MDAIFQSQVEKNIDYFLERVTETQEGFLKKLKQIVWEVDSLKFEIASKYHVMACMHTAEYMLKKL